MNAWFRIIILDLWEFIQTINNYCYSTWEAAFQLLIWNLHSTAKLFAMFSVNSTEIFPTFEWIMKTCEASGSLYDLTFDILEWEILIVESYL